jgi:hypothetical protein
LWTIPFVPLTTPTTCLLFSFKEASFFSPFLCLQGQPTPDPPLFLDPATPPSLKNHIGTQEPVRLDNPSEKTVADQENWDPKNKENQENPNLLAPYPRPLEIGTLSPSNLGSQSKFSALSSRSPLLITESIDTNLTKKHAIPTSTSQEKQK